VFVSSCVLRPGCLAKSRTQSRFHFPQLPWIWSPLDVLLICLICFTISLLLSVVRVASSLFQCASIWFLGCSMREHFVTSAGSTRAVPSAFQSWSSPPITSFWYGLSRSCACYWSDSVADIHRQGTCFPCSTAAVRLRILSWSVFVFADFIFGRAASGLHLTLSRSVSPVRPISSSCSRPSTQAIVSVSDFIRACLGSAEESP
jgi:hypothetical protein